MQIIQLPKLSARGWIAGLTWDVALILALCTARSMAQDNPTGPPESSDEQASANEDNGDPQAADSTQDAVEQSDSEPDGTAPQPCVTDGPSQGPCTDKDKLPRFVVNSPFDDPKPLAVKKERRLWADSWLYADAPKLVVDKWLSDKPDTKGKYVLIELWAPWCPPCRRSLALLNRLHKKYGEELIVIGVSEEDEKETREVTKKYPDTEEIEFFSAIDPQKRMKEKLGVWGIPHVIVLEPKYGCVIWEGFPLQKGYELTDEIVERFLAVGRKAKATKEGAAAEE